MKSCWGHHSSPSDRTQGIRKARRSPTRRYSRACEEILVGSYLYMIVLSTERRFENSRWGYLKNQTHSEIRKTRIEMRKCLGFRSCTRISTFESRFRISAFHFSNFVFRISNLVFRISPYFFRLKFRSTAASLNSRLPGENRKPSILGVTRYAVPAWNPLWIQAPSDAVKTEAGAWPVPEVTLKLIITPPIPLFFFATVPEAPKSVGPPPPVLPIPWLLTTRVVCPTRPLIWTVTVIPEATRSICAGNPPRRS